MGTDSAQSMDILNQGLGMLGEFADRQGRSTKTITDPDAKADARSIQRNAADQAQELRDDRERGRARRNTGWGGSGLAMSGSKRLLRDARMAEDQKDEEDVLLQGELDARERLRSGRMTVSRDKSPDLGRSLLSLGSKIYRSGS